MVNRFCASENCRWKTYRIYKLIMFAWMMNEVSVVFSPIEISHDGLYVHGPTQLVAVIFIGIPLVYSEICIAQYTNCNLVTMWNFLPIFRSVGYGAFYLVILKTLYIMVLTSWYLEYTFYSAHGPPPWFTCDDFNTTKCMIKRVNVSMFQHCIEAEALFDTDCGMKTGSNCFFEREIGNNNTKNSNCVHLWKVIIASCTSGFILFILSIKREKFIQTVVKLFVIHVCIVVFILFWVVLSSSGTWYATKVIINWYTFDTQNVVSALTRGILSCGAGFGIITFLSRDVSFRSPATMTSVAVPLWSMLNTSLLAFIILGGIKTMSYFHGEEENVFEVSDNLFFTIFTSATETLMYFNQQPFWTFLWFKTIFFCLFMNLWILYLFLQESMFSNIKIAKKNEKTSSVLLIGFICALASLFYCSDIAAMLNDVVHILQLTNIVFFSIAVYWCYGFKNHSVDITFMIGVKPSLYWKTAWILSPIVTTVIMCIKWTHIISREFDNSYIIKSISTRCDELLLYILVGIYFVIILMGMFKQIKNYYCNDDIRNLFYPTPHWGPEDRILLRSRKMFVPEIMTREFLYRQVRIRGYSQKNRSYSQCTKNDATIHFDRPSEENIEWNAMASY